MWIKKPNKKIVEKSETFEEKMRSLFMHKM